MATLTKSTGTVTLSGSAEKVTLPSAYGWVWLKNMSDADMFAGLSADISEGADGVMVIPAGECGRIQTDGFNSIYLMGTGNALVVAQNYADCPFKARGKGGESPDLSAYAKTADVPNIKVNAAVNADTVGGHSVGCDVPENAVFTDTVVDINTMVYTVAFDGVTWEQSGLGKFYCSINLNNVNKIISVSLGDFNNFSPDEIVQPIVLLDQQIGIISNVAKSNGKAEIHVAYISGAILC